MHAPHRMSGTDKVICLRPLPRSLLANATSSTPGLLGPGSWSDDAIDAQQVIVRSSLPHCLVGMPCGVAEQRKNDDQSDKSRQQAGEEESKHDRAPDH